MLSSERIQITRPQELLINSPYPNPAMFGGFGSGKSEGLIIRLVTLMEQDPGVSVGHYFPSYKLAKRRGLSGVQAYLKRLGYEYTLNKSDLTITIPALNNGIYYLDTYHDPDAIVSYEIAHGGVDELDTLKTEQARHAWTKITERIRQKTSHPCGNTLAVASTTDQGMSGFCYETWGNGENVEGGYHYIKAGTDSNKFLPDGYVEQICKNYDPIMAEAFVSGGWVSFTRNKVYHFFSRAIHHTDRTITDADKFLHIGLDFNVGGTCATTWLIENNQPIAVDEFVSHDTYDFVNNLSRYDGKKVIIYPDASGRSGSTNATLSDIGLIEKAGYQVDAPAANPAVRDRINAWNGLLSHNKTKVNTDKCPNLAHALETQGYDKKGDPEKFTDHPAVDDWLDCSGYFINRKWPIHKPMIDINVRF
jgi:hypothetical protein